MAREKVKGFVPQFIKKLYRSIYVSFYKFLNKKNPSGKVAFVCHTGYFGGAERVMQMHVNFASEKYETDVILGKAVGPIKDELKRNHKILTGRVLSYKMLRYKYIYLAQVFPNLEFIKRCNPECRISFILHDHLSGSLEELSMSPDTKYLDHIFCISKLVRDKFLEKAPWYPEERITVLYNPYFKANDDYKKVKRKGQIMEDFTVGYMGRVSPEKNTVGLIKIFKKFNKRHPKSRLVLAGPILDHLTEYRELFLSEIGGNPNIEYVGPYNGIDQPSAEELFSKFDCLAFSSFVEGIALTATEAMSYGIPVISTNVGAQAEVIKEGVNGVLVDIEPIKFNPFGNLKPPFEMLSQEDEDSYVKGLEKVMKTKWNYKKISQECIEIFGHEAAKKRLLDGIELILGRPPLNSSHYISRKGFKTY